jgi:hypothetical protein
MSVDRIIATLPTKSAKDRAAIRENAERWLAAGTEQQQADAGRLLAALDELEASEQAESRQRLSDMPVAERVVEAFRLAPLSEHERKLIQVLLDHPGSTTTELTRAAGLGDNMVWQMHFGTLCKSRQAYLWPAERAEHRDGLFFSGILADIDPATNRFTLKPDVVAALAELGFRSKGPA